MRLILLRYIAAVPTALACIVVAHGCRGARGLSDSGVPTDVSATAVLDAFEGKGLNATQGRFEFLDISKCCEPDGYCFGNNPTSPYAAFFVPRPPEQTEPNLGESDDGFSSAFRLRTDEAVVFIGDTPPPAAYFGFTPYVFDRQYPNQRSPVFASLGDTLNNLTIATRGTPSGTSGNAFSSQTAVIAAADRGTEQRVRLALIAAGIPENSINTLTIPSQIARLGLHAEADTVGVFVRMALPENAATAADYIANPGALVFRVSPREALASDAMPVPFPRQRGTGTDEAAYRPALDRLEAAIRAGHASQMIERLELDVPPITPEKCLESGITCAGDNRDTIYPLTPWRTLDLPLGTSWIAFGVNHEATGKASYSNVTLSALDHLVGVVSVTSREVVGSARDWLPHDPDVDKLYAWRFARRCNGAPHCSEVPATCPGVPALGLANIAVRAYVEPATSTAPLPSELEIDRVLRITR